MKKKKIVAVTRTVFTLAGFNVGVTVVIPKEQNPIKIYESDSVDHTEIRLYLDYPSFITITFPRNKYTRDIDYNKLKVSVGIRWKVTLEHFLDDFLKIFERDDIFFLENGKLKMYLDLPKDVIRQTTVGNDVLGIRPSIVTDFTGNEYEGCILTLNKEGIEATMTHQELVAFKESIEAIDLFLYSQALLLYVKGILK